MITEEWKVIDGYEGRYEISNMGNVRRTKKALKTLDGRPSRWEENSLLSLNSDRHGYLRIQLWNRETHKRDGFPVHRLVAEYFIGTCPPDKEEINHKDGNKQNNFVDNLQWVTHQENIIHSFDMLDRMKTVPRGSAQGTSKLNENDIPVIRDLSNRGYSSRRIGKMYNVSSATICSIVNRKTWKHVPDIESNLVQLSLFDKS